jgi:hypothetical protein
MKHVLKEYIGSDLVLNEFINPNGDQVLHLYLKYEGNKLNYTAVDANYKNAIIETLREKDI